jgi:penicillin-binding protein 1A
MDFHRKPERSSAYLRRHRLVRWALLAFSGLFVMGLIGVLAVTVYFIRITRDVPEIKDLASYRPPVMTRVHAGDGALIAEYAQESRVFVPIEGIPPYLVQSFVAAEDQNFYKHNGLDYAAIIKAQIRNVGNCLKGRCTRQGGSTITQQVAKNFKFTAEQTIERKAKEAVVARRIEKAFDKDTILELYLNEIYLGQRAYGVAAAGLLYFGKPLEELTLGEAAYLAALAKGPSNYHPIRNKDRAIARRNWVLLRLEEEGYIDRATKEAAQAEDLVTADRLTGNTYRAADYFVEEVRRLAFDMYGEEELYQGGLSIRTTLDTQLQVFARNALRKGLIDFDRRYAYRGPIGSMDAGAGWSEALPTYKPEYSIEGWDVGLVLDVTGEAATIGRVDGSRVALPAAETGWASRSGKPLRKGDLIYTEMVGDDLKLRQVPEVNGGLIAMDPFTGRVLAMMGGFSFSTSQFNRVTQARRQPGSAFKPFVYAAALDAGKTPVSKVLDAPYVSMTNEGGTFYKPTNYTDRWYGESTLRLGMEQSRNAMTVRLANEIGLENVSAIGERMGVYDRLPAFEAMSLGAGETTLWRMAAGYSQFINGGKSVSPTILDRVQDRDGKTLFSVERRECNLCDVIDIETAAEPTLVDKRTQTIDPVTAYQITSMLEGVIERGTATRLKRVGKTIGGKTGTTNDFKDAWFVGFSPNLVVGVYIGFDTPSQLGSGESGGIAAAPIFGDFMMDALEDAPDMPFRIPPGVRLVPVDAATGDLAPFGDPDAILEAFRPGTEPKTFVEASDGEDFSVFAPEQGGISFGRAEPATSADGETYFLYDTPSPLQGFENDAEARRDEQPVSGRGLRAGLISPGLASGDDGAGDPASAKAPTPAEQGKKTSDEKEGENELGGLY